MPLLGLLVDDRVFVLEYGRGAGVRRLLVPLEALAELLVVARARVRPLLLARGDIRRLFLLNRCDTASPLPRVLRRRRGPLLRGLARLGGADLDLERGVDLELLRATVLRVRVLGRVRRGAALCVSEVAVARVLGLLVQIPSGAWQQFRLLPVRPGARHALGLRRPVVEVVDDVRDVRDLLLAARTLVAVLLLASRLTAGSCTSSTRSATLLGLELRLCGGR